MRLFITTFILTVLAAALLLTPGCSDDPITTEPTAGTQYPEALTRDILMENFAVAYTERAFDLYSLLLDDDFVFTLLPCDVVELGLKSDHWNRESELASAKRMFSGKPYTREDGTVVPAITAIEFQEFRQVAPWHEVDDATREGVQKAIYDMRIRFVREGTGEIVVAGPGTFYSVPVADRRGAERYKLLAWVDQSKACQ